MKKLVLVCVACFISVSLFSQVDTIDYPVIGKRCPDFILKDVQYHSKNKITPSDLKGKFVILDFWSRTCSSCIAAFPYLNKLEKEFSNNLVVILVGYEDDKIRDVYETYKRKLALRFPIAYDTLLFNQFKIQGVPYDLWIDSSGIVRAVTSSDDVNRNNISDFIAMKSFMCQDLSVIGKRRMEEMYRNNNTVFDSLHINNDTTAFYSEINIWDKSLQPLRFPYGVSTYVKLLRNAKQNNRERLNNYLIMGIDFKNFFELAYLGNSILVQDDSTYPFPIINVKDTSGLSNFLSHRYNYLLHLPKRDEDIDITMHAMQHDLEGYFGYIAYVKYQEMPCLELVASKEAIKKLRSQGASINNHKNFVTPSEISIDNLSFKTLAKVLEGTLHSYRIIDGTNSDENIDIELKDVPLQYLDDVKAALNKIGIDLVPITSKMKTLIITDKK
ncbi:MAG: TlpA family protein disulfide reductase [Chitinophagaceae bacterium]|nr:MAG: TlpA family protein disulfide reductase [Chitinophagaceae bacterium]